MLLPTPANCAVLFLDLQEGIVPASQTNPRDRIERAAGVLAELCALHRLPAYCSLVNQGGDFLTAVTGPLGGGDLRPRVTTSAFSDTGLVTALEGRQVLILAGVASEIVVQRTALDALAAGFQLLVAVDASGGLDPRTEAAAWSRITAEGGRLSSVVTLAAELAGDFTSELGGQTLGLMYRLIG